MSLSPIIKLFKTSIAVTAHKVIAINDAGIIEAGSFASVMGITCRDTEEKQNYAIGEYVPVQLFGIGLVTLAETVSSGDYLITISVGTASKTIENNRAVIGYAMEDGIAGDIIKIFIRPVDLEYI